MTCSLFCARRKFWTNEALYANFLLPQIPTHLRFIPWKIIWHNFCPCTQSKHGHFDMLLSPIYDILADISCTDHLKGFDFRTKLWTKEKEKENGDVYFIFLKSVMVWFLSCVSCIHMHLTPQIVSEEAEWSSTKSRFKVHSTLNTVKNHHTLYKMKHLTVFIH